MRRKRGDASSLIILACCEINQCRCRNHSVGSRERTRIELTSSRLVSSTSLNIFPPTAAPAPTSIFTTPWPCLQVLSPHQVVPQKSRRDRQECLLQSGPSRLQLSLRRSSSIPLVGKGNPRRERRAISIYPPANCSLCRSTNVSCRGLICRRAGSNAMRF
jgi:hypothetical protein